jgi:hypothetical protein
MNETQSKQFQRYRGGPHTYGLVNRAPSRVRANHTETHHMWQIRVLQSSRRAAYSASGVPLPISHRIRSSRQLGLAACQRCISCLGNL